MADRNSKKDDVLYTLVQIKETEEKIKQLGEDLSEPLPRFGSRHVQVLLGFCAMFLSYGIRASLSVAIVAMTDPKINNSKDISTYSNWPVSLVLSSFFWGYILPQAVSGWATSQFGAKWLLVCSAGAGSALGFFIPWSAAHFGYLGVCILRAAQGLFLGCIVPCVLYIMSQWVPPSERARLITITTSGIPVGTVFSLIKAGLLAGKWGWPVIFYFYSTLGLLWCIAMAVWGYNRPADNPNISAAEKFYIEVSLGHRRGKKKTKTPWKAILTSAPVWSLLAVQTGSLLLFYTLLTQIPTYINHVMKFSISNNSILSALPFVFYWIISLIAGWICDYIINKNYVTTTTARKIFNSIGMIIPAKVLMLLAFTESHEVTQGVILLIVAVAINSTTVSGWLVNPIDLAPNHAGTVVGLLGTIGNCTGFIGPLLVQYIVKDLSNLSEWRIVFLSIAAFAILTAIVYCLFGSGEVQAWNDSDEKKDDDEVKC